MVSFLKPLVSTKAKDSALKIFTTNCRSSVASALPPVKPARSKRLKRRRRRSGKRMRTAPKTDPAVPTAALQTTPSCCCHPRESWMRSREPPGAGSRAAARLRLARIAGDGATTRHQLHSCPIFQVIFGLKPVNIHPNVPQAVLDRLSRGWARLERFPGFCAVLHGKHRQSSAAVRYPASHIYLSGNFMTIWQIVRKSTGQIYCIKFRHIFCTALNIS